MFIAFFRVTNKSPKSSSLGAILYEYWSYLLSPPDRPFKIIFVASADRAFSESERQMLKHISAWKKKVVFVLSKVDFLEGDAQVNELTTFVGSKISSVTFMLNDPARQSHGGGIGS